MSRRAGFIVGIGVAVVLAGGLGPPAAKLKPEGIARLGADLTPLGAERAGNEDGTIPPWEGGITEWPEGYEPGMRLPDPFEDDEILFTITAENQEQYADRLTAGQRAMLEAYPDTFMMHVYPTRRSASNPQRIYDATREIAATAELVDDGNGVAGAVIGIPFPIPENGLEVIWNHVLRFTGDMLTVRLFQAAPTRGGSFTVWKWDIWLIKPYSYEGMTEERLGNRLTFYKRRTLAPARLAGNVLITHDTTNQVREQRSAWVYNPGQRRVRRAPHIGYDNPAQGTDGLRTNDTFDMFNGGPDRYDWKLVGKREVFVPYNAYRLWASGPDPKLLTPLHLNPDYLRYELHRVWVVEATLKPGARHIYKRRTLYVDEDSWMIVTMDLYDKRDQLWRVSEAPAMNSYDLRVIFAALQVHTDLQAGRYVVLGGDTVFDFDVRLTEEDFTPAALRREGKR